MAEKKKIVKNETIKTASGYTVDIKRMRIAFIAIIVVASILLTTFVTGVSVNLGIIAKKVSFSFFCFLLPVVIIFFASCLAAYSFAIIEKKQ